MTEGGGPPLLDDVAIPGDVLRPRGQWLPLRPARPVRRAPAAADWPEAMTPEIRDHAERIVRDIRERALTAATETLREKLRELRDKP